MIGDIKKLRFNFKIWLETENSEGILGYGQMRLLKAIHETGTLNKAIEKTGFHYRKSWGKLKKIEELLGFKVIHTHRGGSEKGQTVLTEEGKVLIEVFDKFHDKYEKIVCEACEKASNELNKHLSVIGKIDSPEQGIKFGF